MTEGLSCGHRRADREAVKTQTFGLLLWGTFAGSALHPQETSSLDPFSAFRTPLGKIHPYTRFACSKRKRSPVQPREEIRKNSENSSAVNSRTPRSFTERRRGPLSSPKYT